MTVSLGGITFFKNGESEFSDIKTLKREVQKYQQVKKIPFFRDYVLTKVFKHWNSNTVSKKFQSQCKFIGANLFNQNVSLQGYISFLHYTADDFRTSRFLEGNIIRTMDLDAFKKVDAKSLMIIGIDENEEMHVIVRNTKIGERLYMLEKTKQLVLED